MSRQPAPRPHGHRRRGLCGGQRLQGRLHRLSRAPLPRGEDDRQPPQSRFCARQQPRHPVERVGVCAAAQSRHHRRRGVHPPVHRLHGRPSEGGSRGSEDAAHGRQRRQGVATRTAHTAHLLLQDFGTLRALPQQPTAGQILHELSAVGRTQPHRGHQRRPYAGSRFSNRCWCSRR